MVAVQVLLMNYFILGLHNGRHISNDVILPDLVTEGECPYGCEQCSPINGCVSCKPPFFLLLQREGVRQTASCTRACPPGFYKLRRSKKKKKKKQRGFCAKCLLRGCIECSTRHYCSECRPGLVRHAGRCRRRCPKGTGPSPRAKGLCVSVVPDSVDNDVAPADKNSTSEKPKSSSQEVNGTASLPPSPPPPPKTVKKGRRRRKKKKKKKKRRKPGKEDKGRKREGHRRRKHKRFRLRNRRRKERKRRRRKLRRMRERRRKDHPLAANATATTTTTTAAAAAAAATTTAATTASAATYDT